MRRRAKARRRNTLSTDEGDLLRCDADQVLSEHPTLANVNFCPIFSIFLRSCDFAIASRWGARRQREIA